MTFWETSAVVLLTCTMTSPVRVRFVDSCGLTVMPATSEPARPAGVSTRTPELMVAVTKVVLPSPRSRLTSVSTSLIVVAWVVGSVVFWKANVPVRLWPSTVIDTFVPITAMLPASIRVESTLCWLVVVLMSTWKVPLKATPGMLVAMLTVTAPYTPPPAPESIETLP